MKYLLRSHLLKPDLCYCRNVISSWKRLQSTSSSSSTSENPISTEDNIDIEEVIPKKPIERNKSRLLPQHRNILLERKPYDEPQSWIHLTEKYQKKIFGKYGLESGIDPSICFYTKEQKELQVEYERVAYPFTLQEMMKINQKQKEAKRQEIQKREDEIAKKLGKLEQWKTDLNAKIAKKEAEALAAKQRKERLIEEVRRHFGFKVDPREERFKELLEQKEKEDRKKQKEAKKKAKESKMMAKLVETTAKKQENEKTEKSPNENNVEKKDNNKE